jgi:hypothetical protein
MAQGQNREERLFWTAASEIRRIMRSNGTHAERLLEIENLLHDMREDAVNSAAEEPSQ